MADAKFCRLTFIFTKFLSKQKNLLWNFSVQNICKLTSATQPWKKVVATGTSLYCWITLQKNSFRYCASHLSHPMMFIAQVIRAPKRKLSALFFFSRGVQPNIQRCLVQYFYHALWSSLSSSHHGGFMHTRRARQVSLSSVRRHVCLVNTGANTSAQMANPHVRWLEIN